NTAIKVVDVVLILLINVCIKLSLIILANNFIDLIGLFRLRMFSLIRSNTTMVLLIVYPIIVNIAATMVASNSICVTLNATSMKKTSWSNAIIAVIAKKNSKRKVT